MSLTQSIMGRGHRLGTAVRSGLAARSRPRRVVVVEQAMDGAWKWLEAEVSVDGISIEDGCTVSPNASGAAGLPRPDGHEVLFVPDLQTSVFRVLDLPDAAPEQVERLVAMRLEVELPFQAGETTWVCEPYTNGAGTTPNALLIAATTREIAEAENALRSHGLRSSNAEFAPAALSELVLAGDNTTATFAGLGFDTRGATLVIGHDRRLYYVRTIRNAEPTESGVSLAWVPELAREINQSLYDYLLRTGYGLPACLYVSGVGLGQAGLNESLEAHLEVPVRAVSLPETVRTEGSKVDPAELLSDYPVCVGSLLAVRRRMSGTRSLAPPLHKQKTAFEGFRRDSRTTRLALLNVGLFVVLVAVAMVSQSMRLDSTDRLLQESAPAIGSLDRLQEEVNILKYEEKRPRSMLDTLNALVETLPAELKIESLNIDSKGKVTIAGKAPTVELASDTATAAIKASKSFTQPEFHGATKESDGFGFRITCELKGGAR